MNISDNSTPIFAIISRLASFTASAKGHGACAPFAGAAFTAPHQQRRLHLPPSPSATYERQAVMEEDYQQNVPQRHSEAQVACSCTIHAAAAAARAGPGPGSESVWTEA